MPITAPNSPDVQPQNAYLPAGVEPLVMEMFGGLNTETDRSGVPDNQCYWIDGFFPYAPRKLRKLPDIGSYIYNTPTVVFFQWVVLGTTAYCIIFKQDGSVVSCTSGGITSTILPVGTIGNPNVSNCGVSQWSRTYAIIVTKQPGGIGPLLGSPQANGYWLWDGTNTYEAGTLGPIVTITSAGSGYVQNATIGPTIIVEGGFGGGASLSACVVSGQLVSVVVANPGQGWLATDTPSVTVIGGTITGSGASIKMGWGLYGIEGGITLYTVSSVTLVSGGSNYINPVVGYQVGSGVIFYGQPVIVAEVNNPPSSIASITLAANGFATGPGGTNPVSLITAVASVSIAEASLSVELMPFGIQGTTVETYQSYVWIANGPAIIYSAPGSPVNFSAAAGGGDFVSANSYLRSGYVRLVSANGFLYLIGDSSMDYISGVQTTGSVALTTTFTNQNADPEVGSPYAQSVLTDGRNILFANSWGIFESRGAALEKISDALDGVWNNTPIPFLTGLSAAKATIFGKKCWMVLAPVIDPISGVNANKLFLLNDKKWFTSTQSASLIFIGTLEQNSQLQAWGSDGTIIAPLFSVATSSIYGLVQSKYWDQPGGIELIKSSGRFWSLWNYATASQPSILLSIDAVVPSQTLTTQVSQSITLSGPGTTGYYLSPPQAIGQQGALIGFTLRTYEEDVTLISAKIGSDPRLSYRG